jgi:hypothetical protein
MTAPGDGRRPGAPGGPPERWGFREPWSDEGDRAGGAVNGAAGAGDPAVDRETDGVDGVVVDGRPVHGGPVGPAGPGGPAGHGTGDPAASCRFDGTRAAGGAAGPVVRLFPGVPEPARPVEDRGLPGPVVSTEIPGPADTFGRTDAFGRTDTVAPVNAVGTVDAGGPVDPLVGLGAGGSGALGGGTVYRAACPECKARFELGPAALRLAIGATRRTTFYSFTCPDCGAVVRKPAGERIVELLTGGGVRTIRLHRG